MIPVIDLFAGAGGLGEGFAACKVGKNSLFRVRLSIEQDTAAHKTLELRAFYRQFPEDGVPDDYYYFLKGGISLGELFERHPGEARAARQEARCVSLGASVPGPAEVDEWIESSTDSHEDWVLVGGPPCQAYSIAGRGRNRAIPGYVPEADGRHFLYQEYLRVIARHWPPLFVMENVPGILSAKVGGVGIFERILEDLSDPAGLSNGVVSTPGRAFRYRLYSLVNKTDHDMFGVPVNPMSDFIIESQRYGIPQSRHRVIVLGVRDDIGLEPGMLSAHNNLVSAGEVLAGLPRLRSGLARRRDSGICWLEAVRGVTGTSWYRSPRTADHGRTVEKIRETVKSLKEPRRGRGGAFVRYKAAAGYRADWYLDGRLDGVCNSETRAHFLPDLHRYIFAASFASAHGRSPGLAEFPDELMPEHRSVEQALTEGDFGDRFRVQLSGNPSTTITSHIARDGHYYIHFDPSQCRSLTVREAARLQTFPDNYFFFGNRGEQYKQVGNAVPPLLAVQIAGIVHDMLNSSFSHTHDRYAIA